jgi:hypothetical protein
MEHVIAKLYGWKDSSSEYYNILRIHKIIEITVDNKMKKYKQNVK